MKKNIEKKGSLLSSSKQESLGEKRVKLFEKSNGNLEDKINSFTKYSSRQNRQNFVCFGKFRQK